MLTNGNIVKGVLITTVTLYVTCYGIDTLRYVGFAVIHGDWMNDWLTHLPSLVQVVAEVIVNA